VLDVRMPYEFEAGHIEGAVNIPLPMLPQLVDSLSDDRPILCVCQVGQRSDLAARFLLDRELVAFNVEGGMQAWAAAGLPYVRSDGAAGEIQDGYTNTLEW
jgi:rhodanese-related sulfurtransferase